MNAYPDGVENFRYYIVVTTNYFKITNVDVNFPGKDDCKYENHKCRCQFPGNNAVYRVWRSIPEMKRSLISQSSFKSMARAKAGINAPLTRFQTVDYCNQAEQRIVLLKSI